MKKEQILKKVEDCMGRCDDKGLASSVEELLKVLDDEDASRELSELIFNNYNTFKAEAIAKMMEIIIRQRPNLGMLEFPVNHLFRAAVLRGSMELYKCYIEETIELFLKGKSDVEMVECYLELYTAAYDLTEAFFPKYVRCVKGMDFSGAFGRYEKNKNVVLINQEDYELMNDVVEKYNSIVGRRDILTDLDKRATIE